MSADVRGEAFENGADGGNGRLVAGQQDPLGQARPPFDPGVGFRRDAVRGPVVRSDQGRASPGLALRAQFAAGPPLPAASKCITKSTSISG